MAHVEKYLLRAVHPKTGKTIRQKWVYDRYTAECFAADWHTHPKMRTANIYVGKTLIFGHVEPCFLNDDEPVEPPTHITRSKLPPSLQLPKCPDEL